MSASVVTEQAQHRIPLLALFGANSVSLLGNQFSYIAVPWFVLETTGSAARTGVVGFFGLLPLLLGGVVGGALTDRFGFRRMSIVADLGSGLALALIPLLYSTVGLAFWQLLLLVFCRGVFNTPGGTARQGLLPDLTAASGYGRERVNATFQGITSLATLLGAPLAGFLIVTLGPSNVIWLDVLSYIASALIVFMLIPTRYASAAQAPRQGRSLGLSAGFTFIRNDPAILALLLAGTAINFFAVPLGGVILPVYAVRVLDGPLALGAIFALTGAGGLIGTAAFGLFGARLPRRALFIGAFFLSSAPFWALTAMAPFTPVAAAMFINSLAIAPLGPLLITILQERIPSELRGRVFGVMTAMMFAASPLGLLIAGVGIDAVGLRVTLLLTTSGYLLICVVVARAATLRGLSDQHANNWSIRRRSRTPCSRWRRGC